MTTASWSDVLSSFNNAEFRAWGSDYSAHLAAIGLVKTADTGQIDWANAVLPTSGSYVKAGYEIWRFDDSLQASAPIFLQLSYGALTTGYTSPGIWLRVGTGSNGAGSLNGQVTDEVILGPSSNGNYQVGNTTSAFPSYFCHTEGFLGCVFRLGAWKASCTGGSFAISRYCDTDGAPNSNGFVVYGAHRGSNGTGQYTCQTQSVRTLSPAATFDAVTNGYYSLITHGQPSSVLENGDYQVYTHWAPTKIAAPVFGLCTHIASELSQGTTFKTALLGTAVRTFISTGVGLGLGGASGGNIAMLWE